MEELSLSERKIIQKEQERERRRIRDRQRRQSMTVEERETHLARRRRNYQLRRLKAENSRLNLLTTTAAVVDSNVDNVTPAQCLNNVTPVGLEIPADKLCKLPARLRLIHLKHLARSPDFHQNQIDKGNGNSICVIPQAGLRLNRVKRLARSLNSDLEKSTPENEGAMKEKNLLNGQNPQLLPACADGKNLKVVEVEQPYLVSCGNKIHLFSPMLGTKDRGTQFTNLLFVISLNYIYTNTTYELVIPCSLCGKYKTEDAIRTTEPCGFS